MRNISNHVPCMAFWVVGGCIICIELEELLIEEVIRPRLRLKRKAVLVSFADRPADFGRMKAPTIAAI